MSSIPARILTVLLCVAVCACSSGAKETPAPESAAPAASDTHFAGVVGETMDSGGYTYVRIDGQGRSVWAAAPQTAVAVGEEVQIELGMMMPGFHSETLGRTFDEIYFVGGLSKKGAPEAPAAKEMPEGHPAIGSAPAVEIDPVAVPAGGVAIADLWAQKADRAGQTVTVSGKVVKFNAGIMGRNWLHLQDGSGSAEAGTHDLTITTAGVAKVGDLVTVTGKVVLDKDFGAGYTYALLLEEASVSVGAPEAAAH